MNSLIHFIFFSSGISALLFESLWFRQTSLVFGNSVWAASLVLSSFMGGLALGNALSARYGERAFNSLKAYGFLEGIIGITGLGLVFLFPRLTTGLVPLFKPFLEQEASLNSLRFLVAFLLMMIPTSAMGATLPLVVRHLSDPNKNFGYLLGQLYGLNTLGAVIGVLSGEMFFIKYLGIQGTGILAASVNLFLFVLVMILVKAKTKTERVSPSACSPPAKLWGLSLPILRVLAAAFLSGAILLAAEVIWTRFLLLFVYGTSLAFSVLLAAVLCGIGLGGLLASIGLKKGAFFETLSLVACLSGIVCIFGYWKFESVVDFYRASHDSQFISFLPLVLLMAFPTSLLSGMLFTLMGVVLKKYSHGEARSVGVLTFTNTLGGLCGAFLGGFFLLPHFGVERSLFILALAYGVVAVLIFPETRRFFKSYRLLTGTVGTVYIALLVFFPFGLMHKRYLLYSTYGYQMQGEKEIGYRERLTETITYLRKDFLGAPYFYRLITNSYPMSASHWSGRRYMKLYVYLPVALHPNLKKALLISYGVGSTAKAMTDTKSLESIDVVDISKDVLEMSQLAFSQPQESPLADPRVRIHIEDGRYFLQTTEQKFDLITAEPPPPKNAGIQNLYSREYFQLIFDHLSPGGMTSYWLPSIQLHEEETRSILKAFCDVFHDCTLWSGSKMEWMLLGTRQATSPVTPVTPVTEDTFSRQWKNPKILEELKILGFELPEQMGALFIADSQDLKEMIGETEALVDNYPHRISSRPTDINVTVPLYLSWMNPQKAQERFQKSPFIQRLWPQALLKRSLKYFEIQALLTKIMIDHPSHEEVISMLDTILTKTNLKAPVYWLMKSDGDRARIAQKIQAENVDQESLEIQLGINALADRNYPMALKHFETAQNFKNNPQLEYLTLYRKWISERFHSSGSF